MNGESKRSFALALASFAMGAIIVGVLGNPEVRARISDSSKSLVERTMKLAKQADLA